MDSLPGGSPVVACSVEGDAPPRIEPSIRVVAMPADTNPAGDIFGGWLMAQMDLAAGIVAARHSRGRAVTASVEAMSFHHPVLVGDEVSVYAQMHATGRTSMKIKVSAWRRLRQDEQILMVTKATFTFVAVDRSGRPRIVNSTVEPT